MDTGLPKNAFEVLAVGQLGTGRAEPGSRPPPTWTGGIHAGLSPVGGGATWPEGTREASVLWSEQLEPHKMIAAPSWWKCVGGRGGQVVKPGPAKREGRGEGVFEILLLSFCPALI